MKNILYLILLFATSSCTITNKLFHKNKSVIDSTYSHKEKIDSLTKEDSSHVRKENTTTITKSDSSKTDEQTTVNEHTVIKEFNDSGKVKKETVIDKKTETKKGTQSGSLTVFDNAGKIDSTGWSKIKEASNEVSDSGHLQKKEKDVVREVEKKKLPVFQLVMFGLLILLIIYVVKNRKGIVAKLVSAWGWIVKLFTGI